MQHCSYLGCPLTNFLASQKNQNIIPIVKVSLVRACIHFAKNSLTLNSIRELKIISLVVMKQLAISLYGIFPQTFAINKGVNHFNLPHFLNQQKKSIR